MASNNERMILTAMIGQTIDNISFGEIGGDNDAVIIETGNGALYLIESGSLRGLGILSIEEIDKIPENFKEEI